MSHNKFTQDRFLFSFHRSDPLSFLTENSTLQYKS